MLHPMLYLYTLFLTLLLPFILLRLLWRSLKSKGYRLRWPERFGFIPPFNAKRNIWLHAVSLGEVIAALPLIKALRKLYPEDRITITTMTPSGSQYIQQQLDENMYHCYVPYDLPYFVKRFLKRVKPSLAIIMETELWPNLLHYTRQLEIPILLANARLSERSHQSYRKVRVLVKAMLGTISFIAAQSQKDAERFIALGALTQQVKVTGNIKFDAEIPVFLQQKGLALRSQCGDRPIFIAASTHEGEEKIILAAFKKILKTHANVLLILVPRHSERFNFVASLCEQQGFTVARQSRAEIPSMNTHIFLGDTMGQLKMLYAASDIAFIGGSLIPIGGHNFIEAAMFHLPLISGPELQNFILLRDYLLNAKALSIIHNADELSQIIIHLLDKPNIRKIKGENSYHVYQSNQGALTHHIEWIQQQLEAHS